MSLIALVYLSFAKNRNATQEDLKSILEQARRNNQEQDITGLLLYRNGLFIQALEGDEQQVDAIFDVIKDDPRHTNVLVLYKNKIRERNYQDWSMGFQVIDDETLKQNPAYSDFLDKPITMQSLRDDPQHVRTLLNMFRNTG
ncbi:MAG: BLUF domain-containing protein [Chloroflexota bacterium]